MAAKLYTPPREPSIRELLLRLLLVVVLIMSASLVVYFEGGLKDSRTGKHPGYWDCLYFSIITVTTVGYGDIVPVSTSSRLVDAFVLTPLRFIVILIIFGTAYQIVLRRFREDFRMKRAIGQLNGHSILCGCGTTGRAALDELLLQGASAQQIVVIDPDTNALEEAAQRGVICLAGDAAREQVLESAAVTRARHVLVCPGRDDTTALITLTARALNPSARIIAQCNEAENMKLLQRSGADHVINPSLAGGNLMAAATRREHLVDTMQDVLSFGGALQLDEREVRTEEAGKTAADLPDLTVVRVYRGDREFAPRAAGPLEPGDVIVFLTEVGAQRGA